MKLLYRIQIIRITLFVFSLGLIAFALPVLADSEPTVMLIDVQGNAHVPAEKVLGAVANTAIGEPLDSQKVQNDMQSIMGLGYFSNVTVTTEQLSGGVKVQFHVNENPLFKEVTFTGLTQMNSSELKPYFLQKPGEVFNTVTFKANLANALKYCRDKKGLFIEPKIDQLNISADGVVKVELVEMRYGQIKIQGLVKTKDIVVRRELSIKPGDIINYDTLKDEYMRIMRLRLFDSVDINFENASTPGTLNLVLVLKEAQSGSFNIGVQYSQDNGGLGALLGFSDPNVMGMGQTVSMDLNYTPSKTNPQHNVQFSFTDPWVDKNHTSFGISVFNSDNRMTSTMRNWFPNGYTDYSAVDSSSLPSPKHYATNQTYDMNLTQTGLSFSFGRPMGKYTSGQIKFNFQKDMINKFWISDGTDHQDGNGNDLPWLDPNDPSGQAQNQKPFAFWDNSIALSLDTNKLKYKDAVYVNGGYELTGSVENASKHFGNLFNYSTYNLEGKWFKPLSSSWVWGTRIQAAALDSKSNDYPDYDVLYMGGMYKLRGYDDRKFFNGSTESMLGNKYVLANTELRWQPANLKNFEMVGFYDGGFTFPLDGTEKVYKSDYGFGFRYNIPMLGLIRIDQAWNRDHDGKLSITVGEAF